jgi:hypothetical protein
MVWSLLTVVPMAATGVSAPSIGSLADFLASVTVRLAITDGGTLGGDYLIVEVELASSVYCCPELRLVSSVCDFRCSSDEVQERDL